MYASKKHDCATCQHISKSHFNALDADGLSEINGQKVCMSFKKGQTIYHEGMRVNGIYCLNGGIGKLSKLGPKGKDQIIQFVQPGDMVGYRAMISNDPMIGSLIAHTEVNACFIPKEVFLNQVKNSPSFSFQLLQSSCHELGEWGKVISNMTQKSVKERLAEMLLLLEATFGTNAAEQIDIQLSREELANMVGTATESLIRMLAEFKKKGILSTSGKHIQIMDRQALKAEADLMY